MADSPRGVERSVQVYQSLLRAYPVAFRRQYGNEMARVFRELATDSHRRRGTAGLLAAWLRVFGDLLRTVPKEHLTEWKNREGGIDMKVKSVLLQKVSSDDIDCRLGQIGTYGISLLVAVLGVWKFASMRITEPQLFFGILLVAALTLQCVGCGLLIPVSDRKSRSRPYVRRGQIVIYIMAVLAFVLGVWKLASLAVTEYELILGLLLLSAVMMAGVLLGAILPLVDGGRARQGEAEARPRSQ